MKFLIWKGGVKFTTNIWQNLPNSILFRSYVCKYSFVPNLRGLLHNIYVAWCFQKLREKENQSSTVNQVQAVEMYGALHTDLAKSETTWDIKIIITHHLYIYKSCVFTQNLEGVTQKISLPCPWEVWNGQGHGSVIFQATLFKFCGKLTFYKILNW